MFSRWIKPLPLIFILIILSACAEAAQAPAAVRADVAKTGALLSNDRVAFYFPKAANGYLRCEIRTVGKTPRLMGSVTPFSRLLYLSPKGEERRVDIVPTTCLEGNSKYASSKTLKFFHTFKDAEGGLWQFTAVISLASDKPWCDTRYSLTCDKERKVVQFRGPTLFAGEGSFGAAKDEALFPGLEYLLGDERSSSRLDVTSKERKRVAPHPYKVTIPLMAVLKDGSMVGILWDANQHWDGRWEAPQPIFASPNWLEGKPNHLMMLSVPSFPWHEENAAKAATPYPFKPGTTLSIECKLLAKPAQHVTEAVNEWLNAYGPPKLSDKPKNWNAAIDLSLKPYVGSLWRESKTEFGWVPWTGATPVVNGDTCAVLSAAADISKDAALAKNLRVRVDHARNKLGLDKSASSLAYGYRFGAADKAVANAAEEINGLISSQKPDGSWVFDPPADKKLLGQPVESLGERGDTNAGLTAGAAVKVLKFAVATGDRRAAKAGLKSLEFMEQFVRPQGGQSWECPLHAPDLLAASQTADAYLQGFLLTGNKDYLARAGYWARTGLPFIYLWGASDRPVMQGASISVFGASMYSWPWFGQPVQWNGLAYAEVIHKLGDYDKSLPWKSISMMITTCALQEQSTDGANAGLYPDSWNLVDNTPRGPWMQPGQSLLSNLVAMLGRDVDPSTVILRNKLGRIHVTAAGSVQANLNEKTKMVWIKVVDASSARPVVISVAGLAKPASVTCGAAALTPSSALVPGSWVYNKGMLFVLPKQTGSVAVKLTYSNFGYSLPPVEGTPALSIKFISASAVAGQQTECRARLRNTSGLVISDIKASLEGPKGWAFSSPSTVKIKMLAPNNYADIKFRVATPYQDAGERQWLGVNTEYVMGVNIESSRAGAAVKVASPLAVKPYIEDTKGLVVSEGAQITNSCAVDISGKAELTAPEGWKVSPTSATFIAGAKDKITLKFTATAPEGTKPARYYGKLKLSVGKDALPITTVPLEIAVPCNSTKSDIRIDGKLDDWPDAVAVPITEVSEGKIKDSADLSAQARFAWDDTFFFLAVEVTDDKFVQTYSGSDIRRQDSIQVGFDTLRDANTGGYEDDDYEYGFALTPSDILAWRWQCPPTKDTGRASQVETSIVRQGDKTIYEIGIPWSELSPFTPAAGRSFAISILVNDDDGSGKKSLEFGGGLAKQKQPSQFVGVRLRG